MARGREKALAQRALRSRPAAPPSRATTPSQSQVTSRTGPWVSLEIGAFASKVDQASVLRGAHESLSGSARGGSLQSRAAHASLADGGAHLCRAAARGLGVAPAERRPIAHRTSV